ncbi:MAG: tetratricopeptide repeat protein [Candidatus Heimdallarchaeota archaeon]
MRGIERLERKFSKASDLLARGDLQTTEVILKQVIQHAINSSFWDLAGKALTKLGRCYFIQGIYEPAYSAYSWGKTFAMRIGNSVTLNLALNGLGLVTLKMGDPITAQQHLEEALQQGRAIKDSNRVTASLNNLGLVHLRLGNLASATRHYEEARLFLRETNQTGVLLAILINLGNIYAMQGQLDKSDKLFEEGITMAEAEPERIGLLKLNKAYNEFIRDSPAKAANLLREGIESVKSHGIGGSLAANLHLGLAEALIELRQYDNASELLGSIEGEIDLIHPMGKAELLYLHGRLLRSTNQRKLANKYFQKALKKARELPALDIELRSLVRLAEMALNEFETSDDAGKMDEAKAIIDEALQLAAREQIYPRIMEVMTLKALLSSSLLHFDNAIHELKTALAMAEDRELAGYASKIEENIFFVKTQQQSFGIYDKIDSEAELQVRDLSFQQFRNYLRDIEAMARTLPHNR